MMGGGILIWLILGIALYWLLFKKGGGAMGCCGGTATIRLILRVAAIIHPVVRSEPTGRLSI